MLKFSIKIILRDRIKKDGTAPIALQIFIDGQRKRLALNAYCPPEHWDNDRQLCKKSFKNANRVNAILNKYRSRSEEILYESSLTGIHINVDKFIELIDTRPSPGNYVDFVEREIVKEKSDKEDGTIKGYKTLHNHLKEFKPNIPFSDINFEFVQDFERFLRGKKIAHNSRLNYHKHNRKFIRLAIKKGKRIENPYKDFKFTKEETERTWLNSNEIEILMSAYESNKFSGNVHKCLKHFLFQLMTGLRVSDLLKLELDDAVGDILIIRPKKNTKKIVKIPLSAAAKKIIADRDGDKTKMFSTFTDVTMNRMLKDIAVALDINKWLTTHVARHTFAYMYLYAGGKLEELKELLGHSKIETTLVYTHVDFSRKIEGVSRMDNIFNFKIE
jgi:site-specific recombinase XerD